jgi:phage tail-like protein
MSTRMLELLPAVFRQDEGEGAFLAPFLQAFEELLLGSNDAEPLPGQPRALEKQIDHIADTFDAQNTPAEFLDWLASWVALSLRADLREQQQRDFLANTAQRYRRRGTPGNLEELLKIFTLGKPHVLEDGELPHRFAVEFGLLPQSQFGGAIRDYPAYVDRQSSIARAVIELEKPAHTDFELRPIFPTLRISPKPAVPNAPTAGYFSTIGVDTLLGAPIPDPVPPAVTIAATPGTIALGQSATLTWSSTDFSACSASGDWSGSVPGDGSQSVTPTTVGTARYTLSCVGVAGSGTATATAVVIVKPPLPTLSITASPATIALGQSTTLSWSSINASSAVASGDWSGDRAVNGSMTVTPAVVGSAHYALSCDGPGGGGSATAVVTVLPPPPAPTVTITATPATVTLGQSTTLAWSSSDATGLAANGAWSGNRDLSGSMVVTPTAAGSASYALIGNGLGGITTATAAVTVNLPKPTLTFTVSSNPTFVGIATTLTWTSTNASSGVAGGGAASSGWGGNCAANGRFTFTPTSTGTFKYTLTVTGSGGSASALVTLTVNAGATGNPGTTSSI